MANSNSGNAQSPFRDAFEQIAEEVASDWPNDDELSCVLPRYLPNIIRVACEASLVTEEGRPTRFTLLLMDEPFARRAARGAILGDEDVTFATLETPRTVRVNTIRKFAAASDPHRSALMIHDGDSDAAIWGIAHLRHQKCHSHMAPGPNLPFDFEALALRSLFPGHVLMSFDGNHGVSINGYSLERTPLLDIQGLQWFSPLTTHFAKYQDIAAKWPGVDSRTTQRECGTVLAECLNVILRAARAHGRGGTLVLSSTTRKLPLKDDGLVFHTSDVSAIEELPGPGAAMLSVSIRSYLHSLSRVEIPCHDLACRESDIVLDSKERLENVSRSAHREADNKWHAKLELDSTAQFVGQLTGADGVVILDSSFRIRHVGAKIDVREVSKEKLLRVPDLSQRYSIDQLESYEDDRGMRFHSVASYVLQDRGAIAFVISSDGPISALWQQENKVIVAEPLLLV